MEAARRRKIDVVVCWRLDRFGRNLRHLVTAIEELNVTGVAFVSLGESIDTGSPTGRLLLGILGSFAEIRAGTPEGTYPCGIGASSPAGDEAWAPPAENQ